MLTVIGLLIHLALLLFIVKWKKPKTLFDYFVVAGWFILGTLVLLVLGTLCLIGFLMLLFKIGSFV